MRRRLPISTLILFLVITSGAAAQSSWVQNYWYEGSANGLWNDGHEGGFESSVGISWWRYIEDTGDSRLLLEAPDWDTPLVVDLSPHLSQVTCGASYITADGAILLILAGTISGDLTRPALAYSTDWGDSWTTVTDTTVPNGRVIGMTVFKSTDEVLLAVSHPGTNGAAVYRLSDAADPDWTEELFPTGFTANRANFFVESVDSIALTLSGDVDSPNQFYHYTTAGGWQSADDDDFDNRDLREIWRTDDGRFWLAADRDSQPNDPCLRSSSLTGNWIEGSDYFPTTSDPPAYVSRGPSAVEDAERVYLAVEGDEVVVLDGQDGSFLYPVRPPVTLANDVYVVQDTGTVYVSGLLSGSAVISRSTDDGQNWSYDNLGGSLDVLPFVFELDPIGLAVTTGHQIGDTASPRAALAPPHDVGALTSLVYDTGITPVYQSVEIDLKDNNGGLRLLLRTSDDPSMSDAPDWSECEVLDPDDLVPSQNAPGVDHGERYVQYRLEFTLGDGGPVENPVVDTFTLRYQDVGDLDPFVIDTGPAPDAEDVPINTLIKIHFNRPMDLASFNDNVTVTAGGDEYGWQSSGENGDRVFVMTLNEYLPTETLTEVVLEEGIQSSDGRPLSDQNGSAPGLFDFRFTTGSALDDTPPLLEDLRAFPNPTYGATQLTLNCTADDSTTGNNAISAVEYFIDNPGTSGEGAPLNPVDGDFDSPIEDATALVDIADWQMGETHSFYVHAQDAAGNWSLMESLEVKTQGVFLDEDKVYVWPNPATQTATFSFTLGADSTVSLDVYDLAGRLVHSQSDDFTTGGAQGTQDDTYEFVWELDGVGSGVYMFRISAEELGGRSQSAVVIKKLAVVR